MRRLAVLPLAALLIAGCEDSTTEPEELTAPSGAMLRAAPNAVDGINAELELRGADYRVEYAELLTIDPDRQDATTIIASDRGNKRLGLEFIPNDPRRVDGDDDPNTIDVFVDFVDGATSNGLSALTTTQAIGRAMQTWDDQQCSDLGMNFIPVGADLGLVEWALGFNPAPFPLVVGDLAHAGWLPGDFFDLLAPGGSGFILGVAFTLTFTAGDLDDNGLPDLGAREIYYNDAFPWADDGSSNVDVESIALHEAGHGLGQAHFGKVFLDNKGALKYAPRAVMNAVYTGPQRSLLGTDNGGHCAGWGNWPNAPMR